MSKRTDFNRNHPELRKGEVFISNVRDDVYHRIPWNSKRRGMQAYDIHGKRLISGRPVFAQESELRAAGVLRANMESLAC
jgi:hypothetical protein